MTVAAVLTTLSSMMSVALLAVCLAALLGGLAGRGSRVANGLLRRLVELSGAVPIFVAIPLLSRVWPPVVSTIVVLGTFHGLRLACLFRNETQHIYGQPFVRAARTLGISAQRILLWHVLPWTFPPLLVGATMTLPLVLGVEAALASLGLSEAQTVGGFIVGSASLTGLPTLALLLAVLLGLYVLGERLLRRVLPG